MEENNEKTVTENVTEKENQVSEIKEKKGLFTKIKSGLGKLITGLVGVFKDYPLTMGAILIDSVIAAIIIDCDFETDTIYKVMMFFGVFALESIFVEEYFKHKILPRITGYVISAALSVFFVYVLSTESEVLFGMSALHMQSYTVRFYSVLLSGLVIAAVYHMYKRSGEKFETYCINTFGSFLRVSVVYGLLAAGLAIIMLIFNYLIYDTDELIGRIEIFLLGGVYVPAAVLAFSGNKERYGKFSRLVFLYVLEPMLMLAYVIIYLYIVKILVSRQMPSNEVFSILTFLFAAGLFIWTLDMGIEEDDNFFVKASKILPFVYIPFIILQGVCVGMRVSQYGITVSRYLGMALIVFEIIYLIFYTIQFFKKKNVVVYVVFAGIAQLVFMLLIPGTNCFDVVYNSQIARIKEYLDENGKIDEDDVSAVASCYRALTRLDPISEDKVNDFLGKENRELVNNYGYSSYYSKHTVSLYQYRNLNSLDVSDYERISSFDFYSSNNPGKDIDEFVEASFRVGGNYNDEENVDLSDYLEKLKPKVS